MIASGPDPILTGFVPATIGPYVVTDVTLPDESVVTGSVTVRPKTFVLLRLLALTLWRNGIFQLVLNAVNVARFQIVGSDPNLVRPDHERVPSASVATPLSETTTCADRKLF